MNIDERIQFLLQSSESLGAQIHELFGTTQEHTRQIGELIRLAQIDGENIRRLATIAERHNDRLDALDGGDNE